jgi:alginate O-acetyltransferase complex protein AlgI
MLFQTYEYGILLLAVLAIYWALPKTGQNILLIVASYLFYAFVHPWLAILLAGYTLITYSTSIGISRNPKKKKLLLAGSLVTSLAVLAGFKYLGFFIESFTQVMVLIGFKENPTLLRIFLPAGISFYTFQSMAYVIDVYKGRFQARTNLVDVALFISFFPQLVAGPIERAAKLLPQFETKRSVSPERIRDGLFLILWGLFKKIVIADSIAIIVDKIFLLHEPSPMLLATGVLAFGIQIFADFSGYVDIARGSARLLGIDLSVNFLNPYLASSPSDFWRRWHITLSQWFRDYVYIPLGGSRSGNYKNALVLMVTFLLTGLWHGAAWNFILWGGYHGLLILVQRTLSQPAGRITKPPRIVSILITFTLIQIGWFLFRATELSVLTDSVSAWLDGTAVGGYKESVFLLGMVALYSLPLWLYMIARKLLASGYSLPLLGRNIVGIPAQTVLSTSLFLGLLLLKAEVTTDFIYFQF